MEEGAPKAFIDAVKDKKIDDRQVSAFFLAAKSMIETSNGSSELARGKVSGYEGYYNMYGINCEDGPDSTEKGAKYAKENGWDTQEKEIKGGADWIIENYIIPKQDSLYFFKWNIQNIINNKDIALNAKVEFDLHQYATNIADAYVKGSRLASLIIDSKTINDTYSFSIPVFENMPVHAKMNIKKGSLLKGEVSELQSILKELGYYSMKIDGDFGTEQALKDFQRDYRNKGHDIDVTGIADEKTWNILVNIQ